MVEFLTAPRNKLFKPQLHGISREQGREQIILEELPDGLMLRGAGSGKASLRQTFSEMAREQAVGVEDWSDLDGVVSDGIEGVKW